MANQMKYLTAFQLQDGSNMNGLMAEFAREIQEIREQDMPKVMGSGYYMNVWWGHHPIVVMWLSKIMDCGQLIGNVDSVDYHNAYLQMKLIEAYPDSEVCPGCHQPVDAIVHTHKTCVLCEGAFAEARAKKGVA